MLLKYDYSTPQSMASLLSQEDEENTVHLPHLSLPPLQCRGLISIILRTISINSGQNKNVRFTPLEDSIICRAGMVIFLRVGNV